MRKVAIIFSQLPLYIFILSSHLCHNSIVIAIASSESFEFEFPEHYYLKKEYIKQRHFNLTKWAHSPIEKADDTPLAYEQLPFSFTFFGNIYRYVVLNPNGVLQFEPAPICGCCFGNFYAPNLCHYNNSYNNIISVFTNDLNPSASINSSVSYLIQNHTFTISYNRVQLFGAEDGGFSFLAKLWSSGRIRLYYKDIPSFDSITFADNSLSYHVEHTMVGLRPPHPIPSSVVKESFNFPPKNQGREVYFASQPGMYVNHKKLEAGSNVDFCPISTQWCLHNATVAQEGSWLYFKTPLAACFEVFQFYCRFNNSIDVEALVEYDKAYDLSCQAPALVGTGEVPIQIMYNLNDDGNLEEINVASSLSILYSPGAPLAGDVCEVGTNSTCSICGECGGQDAACLGCDRETITSRYDCFGNCNGGGMLDVNDTCCYAEDIDCFGLCYGSGVLSKLQATSNLHICCDGPIDCSDTCDGSASEDSCGICSGGDTGILPIPNPAFCSHYFELSTKQLRMEVSASTQNFESSSTIILSNNANSSIFVELDYHRTSNPKLELLIDGHPAQANVSMGANKSVEVVVSASYAALLSGASTHVKYPETVTLRYFFPGGYNVQQSEFRVFVAMTNCSAIQDWGVCAASPGCLLCLQTTGQRLLSASAPTDQLDTAEFDGNSWVDLRRKAMPSLFPDIQQTSMGYDSINSGICIQGSDPASCEGIPSSSPRNHERFKLLMDLSLFMCVLTSLAITAQCLFNIII